MREWEVALAEFLKEWEGRDDIAGVLVCGSYITGHPSKRSDLDVHLVLTDRTDWRERGNKRCNGILLEYFANPPEQIRAYFREDYRDRRTMAIVQFLTGRVVSDPYGIIERLKAEAREWSDKKWNGLNGALTELRKYVIWDRLDNLIDCYEQQRPDFLFMYHNALQQVFEDYCVSLGLEKIPYNQIHAYLTDARYLEKYLKTGFPDPLFRSEFLSALEEAAPDLMMDLFRRLSERVLERMGGFEIDGWRLRSPLDVGEQDS